MGEFGPEEGKLATIIDIVDQNKCLIEGPEEITGVKRQVIPFKRIKLTDFKVNVLRNARAKTLKKAWANDDIEAKWAETDWAKRLEKKRKRVALNDFDRFKVMLARKKRRAIVDKKLKELEA